MQFEILKNISFKKIIIKNSMRLIDIQNLTSFIQCLIYMSDGNVPANLAGFI